MMTKQAYYDLLVQTSKDGLFPSVQEETPGRPLRCAYRGPNGRKCGIGLLIPDADYQPTMEGATVGVLLMGLLQMPAWVPEGMTGQDLKEVQQAHDSLAFSREKPNTVRPWNHTQFVHSLNGLRCFRDVVQAEA